MKPNIFSYLRKSDEELELEVLQSYLEKSVRQTNKTSNNILFYLESLMQQRIINVIFMKEWFLSNNWKKLNFEELECLRKQLESVLSSVGHDKAYFLPWRNICKHTT